MTYKMIQLFTGMFIIVFFLQACSHQQELSLSEKEKLEPVLQEIFLGKEVNKNKYGIYHSADGTELFAVIIQTDNIEEIKKSGFHLNSFYENKATARLTADELRRLVRLNAVISIKLSRKDTTN